MTKRDWDEAFPETPDAVRQAVFRAFREGKRRDRRRRRLAQGLAVAATLVVMLGLGLLMRQARLNPHPDVLSPGALSQASGAPDGTGSPSATLGPEGTRESDVEEKPLVTAEPTQERTPDVTVEPTQQAEEERQADNASSGGEENAGEDQELFYYLKPRQFSFYYYYYHATRDCATAFRDSQGLDGEVVSGTRADLEKSSLVPCPDCLFQPDKVYYSQGETRYHRDAHCAGMRYALPHDLTDALEAGLTACPTCAEGQTVFLSGDYYHASMDCPAAAKDQKKSSPVSEDGALCECYLPCPECLGADYGAVSADEWRDLLAQGTVCAYASADGTAYHLDPDCAGEGAAWLLCGQALRRGFSPCPECVPNGRQWGEVSYDAQAALPADVPFYFTQGGVYFHTNASCSGMRNAQAHTLAEALASDKQACPTCYPFDATDRESITAYALGLFAQCFGADYPFERNEALEEASSYGKSDVCTFLYGAAVDGGSIRLNSAQINLWQSGLDIEIVMEDPERMADFRSQWTNEALVQAYDRVYAQVQAGSNTESALCSAYVTGVLDGSRWGVELSECTFVFLTTNPATGFRVFISVNYSIAGQHVLSMNWEYE